MSLGWIVTSVRNEVMGFFSWCQGLPQNLLREICLEALDVGETAESRAAGQGQCLLPLVEEHGHRLAETLLHAIRPGEVEHRPLFPRVWVGVVERHLAARQALRLHPIVQRDKFFLLGFASDTARDRQRLKMSTTTSSDLSAPVTSSTCR